MSYQKGVHFTETEFHQEFRRATEADFQVGMTYFRKTRYHALYFGAPVHLPKALVQAAVDFGNDIYSGTAYVKIDKPAEKKPELPKEKEVVDSAPTNVSETITVVTAEPKK